MKNLIKNFIEIIPGRLYLSNGEFIHGGTVWRVRGHNLHTGVVFHHADGGELYCRPAVLPTSRILPSDLASSASALLALLESGHFHIDFIQAYGDGKALEKMFERLSKQITAEVRQQRIATLIRELDERFPDIPDVLRERVRNHDFFYDYSDDINVWRNGMERSAKLQKELESIGALEYMKSYATILHSGH